MRARLAELGHGGDVEWSENVQPPATPEDLAREYVWVVLNSGMRNTVATGIMRRLWPALRAGLPARSAFGHPGKCCGIDYVWRERRQLLEAFRTAPDKLAWCAALPWIGPVTKYHLAKNLGLDVAKPDRWLARLAAAEGESVESLCARLAEASGDRVATVDLVLWRACALGVLSVERGSVEMV